MPLQTRPRQVQNTHMDKTIRVYRSLEAMDEDGYREWQKLLPSERLDAAAELPMQSHRLDDSESAPLRLQRTFVRLLFPER
jgi:hypothetical protein